MPPHELTRQGGLALGPYELSFDAEGARPFGELEVVDQDVEGESCFP